jgi:hypothetical protein
MKKKNTNPGYTIPKEGSLGLLALGDVGLKSWREARGELKIGNNKPEGDEK